MLQSGNLIIIAHRHLTTTTTTNFFLSLYLVKLVVKYKIGEHWLPRIIDKLITISSHYIEHEHCQCQTIFMAIYVHFLQKKIEKH